MLRFFELCRSQATKVVKTVEGYSKYLGCYRLRSFHNDKGFQSTTEEKREHLSITQLTYLYKHGYALSFVKEMKPSFLIKRKCYSTATETIRQTANKNERQDFIAIFPDIIQDLTEDQEYNDVPEVLAWFSKVLQYNVADGKYTRSIGLIMAYRVLLPPEIMTPDKIREVQIMGWCIELLQGFFQIMDDIIDKSERRRGRLCWYRKPDVGMSAVNDASLVECGVYQVLRKHFLDKPYYRQVLDLFYDITFHTEMGETLDFLTAQSFSKDKFKNFTMERFYTVTKYKTTYYTFHFPIFLAMCMAGVDDVEKRALAEPVLIQIGNFYQVQDDYMDCFGDPVLSGKIGSDIQECKLTWLLLMALERCTSEQRNILEECYGSNDPAKVEAIKNIYLQLKLPELFKTYEEDTYNSITEQINQLPPVLKPEIFFNMLNPLYKRSR